MARDRDVAAFSARAHRYDQGWRGQMHHQIADRAAALALTCAPAPRQILDVGCGTGYLLGQLAARAPAFTGSRQFQRRVFLGHRHVVLSWPIAGAEFLEPDDLDQAEPVGVRAGWFGCVHDEPQIRAGDGEHVAVERDGTNLGMVDGLAVRAGAVDHPLRPQRGEPRAGLPELVDELAQPSIVGVGADSPP